MARGLTLVDYMDPLCHINKVPQDTRLSITNKSNRDLCRANINARMRLFLASATRKTSQLAQQLAKLLFWFGLRRFVGSRRTGTQFSND